MGKGYLRMKTDSVSGDLINADFKDLAAAAKKLANHAVHLGSLGFGTTFLEWIASFAAIYLLVLDRTNWKTNILTGLLIPYIFFSLPSLIFSIFRGEIGSWIAFVAVILRLFFPKRFPGKMEIYSYKETCGRHVEASKKSQEDHYRIEHKLCFKNQIHYRFGKLPVQISQLQRSVKNRSELRKL